MGGGTMNKSDTTTNVIASMRELLDRLHSWTAWR
jgi:hypothetical protein